MINTIYSSNIKERREFIKSYLGKRNISFKTQSFVLEGYKGENIIITKWSNYRLPNIIVSAHYDGWGAYDNAGGTAALLWLINLMRLSDGDYVLNKYGLLIIFFDGEENGLLGAKFFVRNFLPSEKIIFKGQISLDGFGIGTHIGGFGNTRKIELIYDSNEKIDFILEADTTIFQENKINSLHLFSLPFEELLKLLNKKKFPLSWKLIHTKDDTPDKLEEAFLPFVVLHLYRHLALLDFQSKGVIIIGESNGNLRH